MVFEEDILVEEEIAVDELLLDDELTAEDIRAIRQSEIDIANGRFVDSQTMWAAIDGWFASDRRNSLDEVVDRLFEK